MNKLGYLSILPFHSLPFRNKGPTDNSPRSHIEYTLKRQFIPRLARTNGLAPLRFSRACQNRSPCLFSSKQEPLGSFTLWKGSLGAERKFQYIQEVF